MDRGQSLIIPPLFDGTNYVYWKVTHESFLAISRWESMASYGDRLDPAKGSAG